MGYIKCCVPNCNDSPSYCKHGFPNPNKDPLRFQLWLTAIRNEALNDLDPAYVYRVKQVCHKHFSSCDSSEGTKRLHCNAIPRLHLPVEQISLSLPEPVAMAVDVSVDGVWDMVIADHSYFRQPSSSSHQEVALKSMLVPRVQNHDIPPRQYIANLGYKHVRELPPKEKVLYRHIQHLSAKLKCTKVAKLSMKKKLAVVKRTCAEKGIEEAFSRLNNTAAQFLACQIREANKSRKHRRFTLNDKILALSLYKQSPRSYRFLANIFILPSKSTLDKVLAQINFEPGIMPHIFAGLRNLVNRLDDKDKFVSIIFDEMAIKPSLHFNTKKGRIEGFEDMGSERRSSRIADHVLVFLLRGIRKPFKQPLCYAFSSNGGAKCFDIQYLLREITKQLLAIGFKPMVTICDQSTTNCKVIKTLLADTRREYLQKDVEYRDGFYEIEGFKIYPLFDPCHLLKGIRNNFVHKVVEFTNNGQKTAKWQDIVTLYECDNGPNVLDGLRVLSHLSDEHIYEKKMRKMKVKHAAQIFSQRVASTLNLASILDQQNRFSEGSGGTAEFLLFFDKLFDSFNGSHREPLKGKMLRCGISDSSDHFRFWYEEALPLLSTMKFQRTSPHDQKTPPSLINWRFNIDNMINIWNNLKKEGFKYILGRHFNQDPVENFFGQIRSQGIRNVNPTCAQFIGAFKSLVINTTTKWHKPTFNCERDSCTDLFTDMKKLLYMEDCQEICPPASELPICVEDVEPESLTSPDDLQNKFLILSNNYVAGFLLKRIRQKITTCDLCKSSIFSNNNSDNTLIEIREYGGNWNRRLCYPTVNFAKAFQQMHQILVQILKSMPAHKTLMEYMQQKLHVINYDFLLCTEHKTDIIQYVHTLAIRTITHSWCSDINKKLNGLDSRPYTGQDQIKINALQMCNRKRKR